MKRITVFIINIAVVLCIICSLAGCVSQEPSSLLEYDGDPNDMFNVAAALGTYYYESAGETREGSHKFWDTMHAYFVFEKTDRIKRGEHPMRNQYYYVSKTHFDEVAYAIFPDWYNGLFGKYPGLEENDVQVEREELGFCDITYTTNIEQVNVETYDHGNKAEGLYEIYDWDGNLVAKFTVYYEKNDNLGKFSGKELPYQVKAFDFDFVFS